MLKLSDTLVDFQDGDQENPLIIKTSQDIPDYWLEQQAEKRLRSTQKPAGNWHEACSVPTVVVEKWRREGFDIHTAPVRDILKRLRDENLGAFISSNKRF